MHGGLAKSRLGYTKEWEVACIGSVYMSKYAADRVVEVDTYLGRATGWLRVCTRDMRAGRGCWRCSWHLHARMTLLLLRLLRLTMGIRRDINI